MVKIVLIHGHTKGAGEGAQNQITKETENQIVSGLLPELKNRLDESLQGKHEVVLLPNTMTLAEKIRWSHNNMTDWDILLEFHLDSSGPRKETGALLYYYGGSEDSKANARRFIEPYIKTTGLKNNGLRADTQSRFGKLGIIRDTKGWAYLVELGSINNDLAIVKEKALEACYLGTMALLGLEAEASLSDTDWVKMHMAEHPELAKDPETAKMLREIAQDMVKDKLFRSYIKTIVTRVDAWTSNNT